MALFDSFKYKCRNCFKLFSIDEKCFNFTTAHRETIENITDLRIPFLAGDEECAKICEDCERVLRSYTKIKQRMIKLQQGFIRHFWKPRSITSDFGGSSTEKNSSVSLPKPSPVKKKMMSVSEMSIYNKDQSQFYCRLCQKGFTKQTSVQRHVKIVHLKIKSFFCDLCQYNCGYRSKFIRHMQTAHAPADKQCSYCGIFVSKNRYWLHLMRVHRKIRCMVKCRVPAQAKGGDESKCINGKAP